MKPIGVRLLARGALRQFEMPPVSLPGKKNSVSKKGGRGGNINYVEGGGWDGGWFPGEVNDRNDHKYNEQDPKYVL